MKIFTVFSLLFVFSTYAQANEEFYCKGGVKHIYIKVNTLEEEGMATIVWLQTIADSNPSVSYPQFTNRHQINFKFSLNNKNLNSPFSITSTDPSLVNFDRNYSPTSRATVMPKFDLLVNNDEELIYTLKNTQMVKDQIDYEIKKLKFNKKSNHIELLYGTWSYSDGNITMDSYRTYISSVRVIAKCQATIK